MVRILQLHRRASKPDSDQAAIRHIVARQREYQCLKALARFAGVPLGMLPATGPALLFADPTSPTGCVQQLEVYVQHRIALARAGQDSA